MNQSVLDLCASFLTLLTGVVEVDGTRMSRDSVSAGARDSFSPDIQGCYVTVSMISSSVVYG